MKGSHKGNGHGYVTETPDVSHIKNVDVTHELSDVDVKSIAIFVVGLTVMTIATYVLMLVMFNVLTRREQEPKPPPMSMSEEERLPAEPRLQSAPGFGEMLEREVGAKESPEAKPAPTPKNPLWEINALRNHWNAVLEQGSTDPNGNAILPVKEAKKELLKQGLPARPWPGPGEFTFSVDMPTAASSGRVAEKRGQ